MNRLVPIGALVIAVALLAAQCLFVVDETEQAIITQFGEPKTPPVTDPGIHFKVPFIHRVTRFEKRFLEWNGDPNEIPTKDKRFLLVDSFARWRIVDPLTFFQRLRDETGAQSRLDDIIDGATRNAVASHNLVEIVRSTNRDVEVDPGLSTDEQTVALDRITVGRLDILADILADAQERIKEADLGIEIVDVRFKRINYNQLVQTAVYQRMIAERNRIAERFRSEGEGESARIRGEKERRLKEIESEAYKQSQEIVGKADAAATKIYAEAYNSDPQFYAFIRTMELYPETLGDQTWLVLSGDNEFLQFLRNSKP